MIHKIFFAMITMFWILIIAQGYVLQGMDITIESKFTINNKLDITAMMEDAGYKDRGEFIIAMEKVTGNYNWDRTVEEGDTFTIPSMHRVERQFDEENDLNVKEMENVDNVSVSGVITLPTDHTSIKIEELADLKKELERLKQVEMNHKVAKGHLMEYQIGEEYNPTYGSTVKRILARGYVVCGTYADTPGFSELFHKIHDGVSPGWYGFDVDICNAFAVAF
jgi:hypothetical protein